MRVLAISGASRTGSNSLKVAKAIKESTDHGDVLSFEKYDIPFFNQGFLNRESLTEFQESMIKKWAAADLVVFVTPEYNWLPSAELINALNHLGSEKFKDLFDEKVFAFAGVSTGTGGRLPAVTLSTMVQKIISFIGASGVCSPHIFEAQQTAASLDSEGQRKDNPIFNDSLDRFVQRNVQFVSKFKT